MTTPNLLVELFVEELPPKALQKLGDAFAGVLFERLKSQGLTSKNSRLTAYASPRRLAAHITEVLAQAPDVKLVTKLMPTSIAFDASGKPTPALLKKAGSNPNCLNLIKQWPLEGELAGHFYVENDGKADILYYTEMASGRSVDRGVQVALDDALENLPIPKVMRYQLQDGWSSVNFVRPAHGLVAMYGTEVLLSVNALGLNAGNSTHGHRFEASVDPVVIQSADSYAELIREQGAVIASFTERRDEIARQLKAAAERVGGGVKAIEDEALLDEVTALVERPNVLVCEFEKEFLGVPQECLILTMKANQKYFPLLDANGKLTNQFLVVSNISPADASAVTGGNERVVRPRLADAKFFFDQDRKKTLASRVDALGKIVYHNKLGTQGERTQRVRAIAKAIATQMFTEIVKVNPTLNSDEGEIARDYLMDCVDNAALLAKTDLVTDMVGEFPELQGIMGGYYAANDGLAVEVAHAIEDHYKPRFAGDELPRENVGVIVALADKLETLVGMFGIGNLPTGDRDPFALRRHALGVIRMLIEKELPLDLAKIIKAASESFGSLLADADKSNAQLLDFIHERLAGYLRELGYSAQEADAVIAANVPWGEMPKALQAVRAFAELPEAPALAAANKRIGNILKKAGEVDAHVNPDMLKEPAEQALYAAMQQTVPVADAKFAAHDYTGSLQTLAALRAPVDKFFDDVMVNADEEAVRLNRQGLLKSLHVAMNRVADLSRLA